MNLLHNLFSITKSQAVFIGGLLINGWRVRILKHTGDLTYSSKGSNFRIDFNKYGNESQASALISIVLHKDDLQIDDAGLKDI